MSLDARIRVAMERDASALEPETDPALRRILQRGPRRRAARTAGRAVALAAVVAVFVGGGIAALRATERGGRGAGTIGPATSVSPIDSQWRTTLSIEDGLGSGLGYGHARQLAGPRQLELSLGVVRQIRPGSFQTIPVNGTFEVDGPFLVIHDNGQTLVMRWTLSGNELHLSLVDDSRRAAGERIDRLIWTTHPWERIG